MSGYNNPNFDQYGKPSGGPPQPPQPPRPMPAQPQPRQGIPPYQGPVPRGLPPGVVPPGTYVPPPGTPAGFGPPGAMPPFPPGQAFARPVKRGPSPALGVLKLLFGLFLALVGGILLVQHGHGGFGEAAAGGIPLGAGLALAAAGVANMARRALGVKSLALWLVTALVATGAGPTLSDSFYTSKEAEVFEQAKNYSYNTWSYDYFNEEEIPRKFWREDAYAESLKTSARYATGAKNVASMRSVIGLANWLDSDRTKPFPASVGYGEHYFKEAPKHAGYAEARKMCGEALLAIYDSALTKLAKPAAKDEKAEFEADEKLRSAFVALLKQLSVAEDATVYVKFSNSVDLAPPQGVDAVLKQYQQSDIALSRFPDGNAPVIAEGEAFSPKFDSKRRDTALKALQEAFSKVFDASLLTLAPLPLGQSPGNKPVFELSSSIFRRKSFYTYTQTKDQSEEFIGLLFAIYVDWVFTVTDGAGTKLYENKTQSIAGSRIAIDTKPTDPDFAPYSIMMDSAYYNFSREITGKFGLVPPAMRTSFAYEAAR
ncbi:MAG: hypothetical protein BroJett014_17570 [Planctomycetota bacterium]|nr:hypothetical protein [Planctomycetota bacterium]GIK52784.1 MAG: hypothetical protein BroJett014_17570 [Planctomycetota bacterium]